MANVEPMELQEEKTTKKINRTRKKGDGGVQEIAPGKFRAFLDIGTETVVIDGKVKTKRKRKTFTGKSQTEVIKMLNKYKAEQLKGNLVADSKTTFAEYIQRWMDMREDNIKATTKRGYKYMTEYHIIPSLGSMRIQKITVANLNDYFKKKLKEGLSACSVVKHRALIHSVFELAVTENAVQSNPVPRCMEILVRHPEAQALTEEQIKALMSTAREVYEKHKGHGNKMYQIFHLVLTALATGFRRGEIAGLTWDCLNETENTITVKQNLIEVKGGARLDTPKTVKSQRTIAVDPSVIQYLKELDDGKSDFIFHTKTGNHLTLSNVHRAFKLLVKQAGLPKETRFHDLRHTHATLLINKGIDYKAVSERLGHSNVSVTLNRYTHAVSGTDRKAANLMSSVIFESENTSEQRSEEARNEGENV
ncbi:tyrosine-type recombinase/integrase [Propionispora hippei]|uniref:Site-specific recombinase XerD n=1 Tax=Propionispora hippei DSM 15287 TaxID=1123003 RepID=A0A1M6KED8_9FIRM|nr:site-specific integrase [Propionispora hippei]SHJ57272.1 Site-specific recombinase XerD [Propionispora hippei DSM 15287]